MNITDERDERDIGKQTLEEGDWVMYEYSLSSAEWAMIVQTGHGELQIIGSNANRHNEIMFERRATVAEANNVLESNGKGQIVDYVPSSDVEINVTLGS